MSNEFDRPYSGLTSARVGARRTLTSRSGQLKNAARRLRRKGFSDEAGRFAGMAEMEKFNASQARGSNIRSADFEIASEPVRLRMQQNINDAEADSLMGQARRGGRSRLDAGPQTPRLDAGPQTPRLDAMRNRSDVAPPRRVSSETDRQTEPASRSAIQSLDDGLNEPLAVTRPTSTSSVGAPSPLLQGRALVNARALDGAEMTGDGPEARQASVIREMREMSQGGVMSRSDALDQINARRREMGQAAVDVDWKQVAQIDAADAQRRAGRTRETEIALKIPAVAESVRSSLLADQRKKKQSNLDKMVKDYS